MRTGAAVLALALLGPAMGFAADAIVTEVEQRLAASGPDAASAWLGARPASIKRLHERVASCDRAAVDVALKLGRGTVVKTRDAHRDTLRSAAGRCPALVLGFTTADEVTRYCASIDAWTAVQTARELRRRIAAIDADDALAASERGKACRAAYLHELRTTRVVLKAKP